MQEEIINAVLSGHDTLALLPTGGGKSICFQVPALAMEGICIVISPLIALMKDQVENLNSRNIPATAVSSGMPYGEVRQTLRAAASGEYKFLYVAPERIETHLFLEFLASVDPSLIAVDEAHCISQWGYDFRPAYTRIKKLREILPGVPVIALTASATPAVQEDICSQLQFVNGKMFRQSFERPNLAYRVEKNAIKQKKIPELLHQHPGSAIVYCKSRKQTQRIAELLNMQGIPADHYHAGLAHEQRNRKQEQWLSGAIRVMVSTNAFGMGIDKPDVRLVMHAESPDCLENYYQEAGRAGRDGEPASAILFTSDAEIELMYAQAEIRFPSFDQLKQLYLALMDHLQVPAGFGEGQYFDIDVATFASHFKFDTVQAYYGIQALAKCGVLHFNESFFHPSTVEFICRREDLADIEHQHPDLSETIKSLLRCYEGIFDATTTIYESQLSRFSKVAYGQTVARLQSLHRLGVIRYQMQSEKPQVYLILNRMYRDDFTVDTQTLKSLKKVFLERLEKMQAYIEDQKTCRSILIGDYFGSTGVNACGICDNCQRNSTDISGSVSRVATEILARLSSTSPTPYSSVETWFEKDMVKKALAFLEEEQLIIPDQLGRILKRRP